MNVRIVKKKASTTKKLGHQNIEVYHVSTLYDLLLQITYHEFWKHHSGNEKVLSLTEINDLSQYGKISFGNMYNEQKEPFEKAQQVMCQDFKDGLFRVFIDGQEYTDLDEAIVIEENSEVVLIKLVMMAGRLW